MPKNNDYSKKILKILSENKALSLPDLTDQIVPPLRPTASSPYQGEPTSRTPSETQKKARYAINRSLKGLIDGGLIEEHFSGQNTYARLSKTGRRKALSNKLDDGSILPNWDRKWRIVLLDLPESRKSERESLRYLLKKAGFTCLKNSAWVSPFPLEHFFMNIKQDLGLTTELMIFVTNTLDHETELELFKSFGK